MKYVNIINESSDPQKIANTLKTECSQWISEYKHLAIYRGFSSIPRGEKEYRNFFKKEVRKDRTPKDISKRSSKYVNKYLKERFGFSRQDSVFASKSPGVAEKYGSTYRIYPIGEFDAIYNTKIKDLYTDIFSYSSTKGLMYFSREAAEKTLKNIVATELKKRYGQSFDWNFWLEIKGIDKNLKFEEVIDNIVSEVNSLQSKDGISELCELIYNSRIHPSIDKPNLDWFLYFLEIDYKNFNYKMFDQIVGQYYIDGDLNEAEMDTEIILNCESYYALNPKWAFEIGKLL